MAKSLKIVSFNCSGFKFRNYDYLKDIFMKCEILLIQETWLYNFQHEEIGKVLVDSEHHAVSAMDECDVSRVGRPYGGCAVVWRRGLALDFRPLTTTSRRLCAVVAQSDCAKLLLVSVYMPNDDNCDRSFEIFGDVLNELSAMINFYDGYDIIIGGDFNVDFSRQSRNGDLLKLFLNEENLLCPPLSSNHATYTYESATGNRSCIDHFIVSESAIEVGECISTFRDGNNLSEHLPIFITSTLTAIVSYTETIIQPRVDWERASSTHIENYKALIDFHLRHLDMSGVLASCHDYCCKAHGDVIMDSLGKITEILKKCAYIAIPRQRVNGNRGIPGWNEYVRPYKDKSIFWHDIWKNAGCPASGQLADLRKSSRSKYHWAIKQVKKNADEILKENTAVTLRNKSFKDFWKTIKKMKGRNNCSSGIIDGRCTDEDIAGRFRDIYEELYSSVPDENLREVGSRVNHLVGERCKAGHCTSSQCHSVSAAVVEEAVRSLVPNKKDETYNISSNHFINGTKLLFLQLSQIITAMLQYGSTDALFNRAVIKPIPKNPLKSRADSSNYRAISINSVISKVIDHVMILIIKDKMVTSHMQFAYKESYSTSLCSYLVTETIQYYRTRGSNVYMLLLDATKAFDRVKYSKLFNLLIERDICPLIVRLLLSMYLISTAVVNWNGVNSDHFKLCNGVKQGGVMSPLLFSVYLNPLMQDLNRSKLGCYMGAICCNAFAYADDIVILSPTCDALRKMVRICEQYAIQFSLSFNPNKCVLIIFFGFGCFYG